MTYAQKMAGRQVIDCLCPYCGTAVTAEIPSLLAKQLSSGIIATCTACGAEGVIRIEQREAESA